MRTGTEHGGLLGAGTRAGPGMRVAVGASLRPVACARIAPRAPTGGLAARTLASMEDTARRGGPAPEDGRTMGRAGYATARAAVSAAPACAAAETRADKIRRLRRQIEAGSYDPAPAILARAFLRHHAR